MENVKMLLGLIVFLLFWIGSSLRSIKLLLEMRDALAVNLHREGTMVFADHGRQDRS
jgi:hypothetical protein